MNIIVALLLTTIAGWLASKAFRLLSFWSKLWKVPVANLERHWIAGHLPAAANRTKMFYDIMPRLDTQRQRIQRFMIGPIPVIVVAHPETVAAILKTPSPKMAFTYSLLVPFVGDGLLVSSGKKWARDRRLLTHAFHFNILQEYTPILHDTCQVLIDKLYRHTESAKTKPAPFDFSNACCLLALDVMLRCAMGVESNCQVEDSQYTKGIRKITESIFARSQEVHLVLLPDVLFFLLPSGQRILRLCQQSRDFTASIMNERREKLKEEGQLCDAVGDSGDIQKKIAKGQVDFLNILLTVKDEDGTGLSDAEIQNQVDTFLFAGHDTTSSAMQWLLYFLAKNAEIQQRCREEARRMSGPDGWVSHDNIGKLTYITQCVKEALRLCTPVPEIERELAEDAHIDGYLLPRGTFININLFALHHCPALYPDPFKFDPERFSEENCERRHPHAFVPFSAGPRNCIGQVLAMNELRVTVASLLVRFEFLVDGSLPEPLFTDAFVMRAKNGINLLVRNLDSS